jgi:hypothetical protein
MIANAGERVDVKRAPINRRRHRRACAVATPELSRAAATLRSMDSQPHLISVNARLASAELGLDLEIRLRQLDGRWLAVADFGGEPEVGIGATPRVALAAALASLGERAAAILMADPQLFGVSAEIGRSA